MLFTLAYLFLDFLLKRKEYQRNRFYVMKIREYVSRGSVAFRHFPKMASSLQLACRKFSLLCDDSESPTEERILAQYLGRRMLVVTPKQKVNLQGWTFFLNQHYNSVLSHRGNASNKLLVLLEAFKPENQEEYLKKWLSLPSHKRIKMKDYCVCIAWKPGTAYGLIVESTLEDFSLMGCAFMEDHLELEDGLEIHKLTTIDIEGAASDLLEVSQFLGSSGKSNGLSEVLSKAEFLCSHSKEMEAMTSCNKNFLDSDLSSPNFFTEFHSTYHKINSSNESLAGAMWPPDGEADALSENSEKSNEDQASIVTSIDWDKSPNLGFSHNGNQESVSAVNHGENIVTSSAKPPNILIYCPKESDKVIFDYLKSLLNCCLHHDSYVIYPLSPSQLKLVPWSDNTRLVILLPCQLSAEDKEVFTSYIYGGGKLLSICSDLKFTGINLHPWEPSDINVKYKSMDEIIVKPGFHSLEVNKILLGDKVKVLSSEANGKSVLVELITGEAKGVAILCQFHLEWKENLQVNSSSEAIKLQILQDLLSNHFHLNCAPSEKYELTPCYMIAKSQVFKNKFMTDLSPKLENGTIKSKHLLLHFTKPGVTCPQASPQTLPIIVLESTHSDIKFNADQYFHYLKTKSLGHMVFWIDVVTTTMVVIDSLLPHLSDGCGAAVIATRQISGKGRGGNDWLSPDGCAMFSFNGQMALQSKLGQRLPFIQHLATLACIQAVKKIPGYEDINLRLKWPNDVYYGNFIKIGGNIVSASTQNNVVNFVIGIGVNVSNSYPTTCINDVIRQHNRQKGTMLTSLTCEKFIALTLSHFEELVDMFQNGQIEQVLQLYYSVWLHGNATVTLGENSGREVRILGLQDEGFLLVEDKEGHQLSLQPDGNTFDIMRNLIVIKSH